jgi:hypothetical protein
VSGTRTRRGRRSEHGRLAGAGRAGGGGRGTVQALRAGGGRVAGGASTEGWQVPGGRSGAVGALQRRWRQGGGSGSSCVLTLISVQMCTPRRQGLQDHDEMMQTPVRSESRVTMPSYNNGYPGSSSKERMHFEDALLRMTTTRFWNSAQKSVEQSATKAKVRTVQAKAALRIQRAFGAYKDNKIKAALQIQNGAALKIQTAFRAHKERAEALRALWAVNMAGLMIEKTAAAVFSWWKESTAYTSALADLEKNRASLKKMIDEDNKENPYWNNRLNTVFNYPCLLFCYGSKLTSTDFVFGLFSGHSWCGQERR